MVDTGAKWCRCLPNGGIQWPQVKPWACTIGGYKTRHTGTSAEWPSKWPEINMHFFVNSIVLKQTMGAKDYVMVKINLCQVKFFIAL